MGKKIFSFFFFLAIAGAGSVLAYDITDLKNIPVKGDFLVGPARIAIEAEPGERVVQNINVLNRTGKEMEFFVNVEDFSMAEGNEDFRVGEGDRDYSLSLFLHPEAPSFKLKHGQRIVFPVTIDLPSIMQHGSLQAAVIIGTKSTENTQNVVTTRIASLFFVRAKSQSGLAKGGAEKFANSRKLYYQNPVDFRIYFKNDGDIFLAPKGKIILKNIISQHVEELSVPEFYVLPHSLRMVKTTWQPKMAAGIYKATLSLDKGYQDGVSQEKNDILYSEFYYFPLNMILGSLTVLLALFAFFIYLRKKDIIINEDEAEDKGN
ncbi:MAG TPA: hypothetical protein PKM84_01080 [Candidatus Pacearchaeota archaeon]|nr:hypothetical protein [Candidatus Pacearchaeota archaeon]